MITAFAGGRASQSFYEDVSWRWGFGCFAIIFPIVAMPLFFILKTNLRKAKKDTMAATGPSDQRGLDKIWYYVLEFDC